MVMGHHEVHDVNPAEDTVDDGPDNGMAGLAPRDDRRQHHADSDAEISHRAVSSGSFFAAGAVTVTVPPAFSTAAIAAFDAPATVKLTVAVNSPLANRRMPSP